MPESKMPIAVAGAPGVGTVRAWRSAARAVRAPVRRLTRPLRRQPQAEGTIGRHLAHDALPHAGGSMQR